jgi:hypothetical protein
MDVLTGTDFCTVEMLTWRGLATYYVLLFIQLETRCLRRQFNRLGAGSKMLHITWPRTHKKA